MFTDIAVSDDRRRHRQVGQAGLDRREALGLLQVVGEEQEDREHRHARDPDREVGAAADAVGDDPERQQRVRDARLDEHERGEQHHGGASADDRHRVTPGVHLGVREAVDQREQPRRGEQRCPRGPAAGARAARTLSKQPAGGDAAGHREQEVHVQAPAPDEPLGEDAAEQQARRAAPPPAIAPKMPNALPRSCRVGERDGEQCERRRREQRSEDALRRARGDEHAEGPGGTADRGGDGEAEQAADERPLAPEQVAEPAAEQQQRAERQRVGGDDPLARVVGEAEVLLRAGQGDVHDRRVQHDHQLRDGDHREDEPAALVMGCR